MESRTRQILIYSLGALLLLTVVTGAAALIIFGSIRKGEAELRAQFVERSACLERIRAGIYSSGTLASDYFAEPEGPDAPMLLQKLGQSEADAKQAFDRYAAAPDGRDTAKLRGEVVTYWKLLDLMTQTAWKRHTPELDSYFRRQLAQRRETMLHIADDIGVALSREWTHEETELARMYGKFRSILSIELVLVVTFGLTVAAVTVRRLVSLEVEARALSAQLLRVQEDERRAIARELHDEIGQALSGLLLDVGSAASIAGDGGVRSRLDSIASLAEHIVEEVRRIALSLRPSMLDDLGLVSALEWQAREAGHRNGLNVQIQAEESAGALPDAHRTCIYRIAQEALQNCAKHSSARCVKVGLQKTESSVSLQVEDDGKGFVVSRKRGMGLVGMAERVAQLGGRFRVHSEVGRGTSVSVELPI